MTEQYDFGPSPFAEFAVNFERFIDTAMETAHMREMPRDYLGASRVGEACERRLGYEFFSVPKDPGAHFPGHILRIFDMGHDIEPRVASYLRLAGFELMTEDENGQQIGFAIAPNPRTGKPQIAGHIDGAILVSPVPEIIRAPCLWENKGLNGRKWREMLKHGVEQANPVYYFQIQTYQAYLELADNPALFTCLNRDTGELYAELVPFSLAAAQAATDKGVRVVTAAGVDDLPRISRDPNDYRCKLCPHQDRCWHQLLDEPPPVKAPGWMMGTA